MSRFELVEYEPPENDPDLPDDFYEDGCEECGGKVRATGGQHYYNGSYNCYTLHLECENCGPYEVECV